MEITVVLAQAARKSGGDKYVDANGGTFNIYVPQVISRNKTGYPADKLRIRIDEFE